MLQQISIVSYKNFLDFISNVLKLITYHHFYPSVHCTVQCRSTRLDAPAPTHYLSTDFYLRQAVDLFLAPFHSLLAFFKMSTGLVNW